MSKMAYLKVQNEREHVLCVECQNYRKKSEAWVFLGVQFIGHASRLWWDGVCDIYKFRPARTDIKGVISALLLLPCWFTAGLSRWVYWDGRWKRQDCLPEGKASIRIHFHYNLQGPNIKLDLVTNLSLWRNKYQLWPVIAGTYIVLFFSWDST